MSQPVGDLVIDLSLDAVRFDEQMSRVRRHFSGLDTVSDNRRRFIFCKYCYDTQVHPLYGVNCV